MKKIIFLLLLASMACPVQAQFVPARFDRDTLTRPTAQQIGQQPTNLADTLLRAPYRIDYAKSWREVVRPDGAHTLFLEAKNSNTDYLQRNYYAFPVSLRQPLDRQVNFGIDWAVFFPRAAAEQGDEARYDDHRIFVQQDTIFTITSPADAGGISPEGQTFRFEGDSIARIEARTRSVFRVDQGIAINGMDDWTVFLADVASDWLPCTVDARSYRLPLIDSLTIRVEEFARLKAQAVAVQRKLLIDKRDSVICAAGGWGNPKYRQQALNQLRRRLKPYSKEAATFAELGVVVELKWFVTQIRMTMTDGRVRRYVHIASYEANIP
ncbi:MAG: hypothetical protein RR410_04535 [Alistipes sp.]